MNTPHLTVRERQIGELLGQGCDNKEIANQLHMARRTVKAHFNRLFLRFGIDSGIKRVKLLRALGSISPANGELPNLTVRQWRLMELVADGMKNGEIAPLVGTTEYVVKNYLREIFDKTGCFNRVELTVWHESHKVQARAQREI